MRRRKLLGALAGLAVVTVGVVVLWPREDRVTQENSAVIREGMSRVEVEAILGPPGDYTTGPVKLHGHSDTIDSLEPKLGIALASRTLWISDTAGVEITFDDQEKVVSVEPAPLVPVPASYFDRYIWRLQRRWRRWFPE